MQCQIAAHPEIVQAVMIDGAFLMPVRKVPLADEAVLLDEALVVTQRVWQPMIADNPDNDGPRGM